MSENQFFELTPDRVLSSVEASGLMTTGRCFTLNSFENRVYDVEIEEETETLLRERVVAKFYRPGRWSEAQILEEHQFIQDLVEAEISAIAPLKFPDGRTLHSMKDCGIRYAIFPRVGGRAPDELTPDQIQWIGRLLGRIHAVGASKKAPHRVQLTPDTYGWDNLNFLLQGKWIPLEFESRYRTLVESILTIITPWFKDLPVHRLHGDCHLGNLLWNKTPFFLDFDDMVNGPDVQDIWLILSGRDELGKSLLQCLLEGYEEIRTFDRSQLRLIEPLRALRYIHYTAWIARRWKDPAFPLAFPQFGTHSYWNEMIQDLNEQLELIQGERHPWI